MITAHDAFHAHRDALAADLHARFDQNTSEGLDALTGGQLALVWTCPAITAGDDMGNREVAFRYAWMIATEIARQIALGVTTTSFTTAAVDYTCEILAFEPTLGLTDPQTANTLRTLMHAVITEARA